MKSCKQCEYALFEQWLLFFTLVMDILAESDVLGLELLSVFNKGVR